MRHPPLLRLLFAALLTLAAGGQTRLYRSYGKRAAEVYTNIQVLKDIDSTELIPTMQFMAESLGVGCNFCHSPNGSDKDDKPAKTKARQMILMTRQINENHFSGSKVVSCVTCHRGASLPLSSLPLSSLPIPDERTTRATPPPAANLPTADQILDKYLQAVGGAAALRAVSTRVEKGTFLSSTGKLPYETYSKAPDKKVAITHLPDGDSITAFDGSSAWIEVTAPAPPGRDLTPSETAAAKLDADLRFALNARRLLREVTVLPPETVGSRPMFVILGKPGNMRPVRFYFDQQTGLLTRVLRYAEVPLGFTPVQTDYADYRDLDGVKIPFQRTLTRPTSRSVIEIDTVRQNVPIDDSRFSKQAPVP